MIKMLVCSFYNTLINEEDAISVETMVEIDRIRNNATFTVLTNRNYEEVLYYNRDYPFIDYIVSLNGAVIYDIKNDSVIKESPLSKEKINLIEEKFKDNKKLYYTRDKIYDEYVNGDIYKVEVELTKKDKSKVDSLKINHSILELNKMKYLEVTETTTDEALKYLLELNKIKDNEVSAIIGNESEKYLLNKIPNISITKRCASSLKNNLKFSFLKFKSKKIEEILKNMK